MAKITYANKVALNENPEIADINKVKDTDMNQIKEVVNANEAKVLLEVSNIAPDTCSTGDMYFNTTTNLIYTATATNTWGSTGVAPTSNTMYVTFSDKTIYMYNGTTLISVCGGAGSGGGDNEPIGKVVPMVLETAPDGYILCDGSTYTKAAYPDLYKALVGTQFIVDTNSFTVPNLKGKVIVGKDSTDTDFDNIGDTGGSKELQEHSHSIPNISANAGFAAGNDYNLLGTQQSGVSGTGHSGNLQPYIVLNYFIKAQKTSGDVILSEDIKIGTIFQWSGSTAPTNYMICDGSAISRTNYAELFSIIGTTYGNGDGSTTFNLPDFRGNVAVGYKNGDSDFGTLGGTGGSKYLQAHSHGIKNYVSVNSGTANGLLQETNKIAYGYLETDVAGTGDSGNLQPYQVVNYIIKVSGTTQLSAQVVNTYNTSDSDTYSCEYVNNSESYSTNEIDTGKKWINGEKIYRLVISGNAVTSNTIDTSLSSYNIDTIISMNGWASSGYSNSWTIPCYRNDGYNNDIRYNTNGKTLSVDFGAYYSSSNHFHAIIEYTKTS